MTDYVCSSIRSLPCATHSPYSHANANQQSLFADQLEHGWLLRFNMRASFQSFCDLSVDGIVGPITWNALVLAHLRAASGQAAADLAFQAWTKNDCAAAAYEAIPLAVEALFARSWTANDGWTSAGCQGQAGTLACTWQRTGEKLVLDGNDSTGAPFYHVNNVTFHPLSRIRRGAALASIFLDLGLLV